MSHTEISKSRWGGLFITSLALAIIIIDTTVLNVSLKDIMRDLNADLQQMQWIITTYSLILAALTITGGRLGDLYGRKKMFLLGTMLFGLGSFIASISTSGTMLMLGWSIVEGIGAALMMPATASMLISNFEGKERAVAFGVWGGIAGAAAAFGPLVGGYLTSTYSWHWAFRINVVIVLIILAGSFLIKESIDLKEKRTLDLVGSVLSALAMAVIVYGIMESSTFGWWTATAPWSVGGYSFNFGGYSITPVALVVGLGLLITFVFWERRVKRAERTPLVSLGIFKNKQFVAGVVIGAVLALIQAGVIFMLPVYFQTVLGMTALDTAKILLPMSLVALVVAPLSGILRKSVPTRDVIQVGLIAIAIGIYWGSRVLTVDAQPIDFLLPFIAIGIGIGIGNSQITNATLSAVNPNIAGEASGINNTARQLGSALGSALIGVVFLATMTNFVRIQVAQLQQLTIEEKTKIVVLLEKSHEFVATLPIEKPVFEMLKKKAMVQSNQVGLRYALGFMAISGIASFFLPRETKERRDKELHRSQIR